MPAPLRPPDLDQAAVLDGSYSAEITKAEGLMVSNLPEYDITMGEFHDSVAKFMESMKEWHFYLSPDEWKSFKRGEISYLSKCSSHFSSATIHMDDAARGLAKTAATWRNRYYAFLKAIRMELSDARYTLRKM